MTTLRIPLAALRRVPATARTVVLLCALLLVMIVLRGSIAALITALVLFIALPGFGLLRTLRLREGHNPVVVLCLGLAAGLGLSITLSWAARMGSIAPAVVALLLMLAALLPPLASTSVPAAPPSTSTRAERWSAFALLALALLVVTGVSLALSQVRTNGWEDQTLLAQIVEWFSAGTARANLASRVVGGAAHPYIGSDGLGYLLGLVAWASGFPADRLVWHALSPLFAWVTPLAAFAITFQLCRRHAAGGLAAACAVLYGLITIDGVVLQSNFAFGYNALFVANTLRMFSVVVLAPLALLTLVTALDQRGWRWLLIYTPLLLAIVTTHPRTTLTLGLLLTACAIMGSLALPRRRWKRAMLFAVVSLAMCAGPTIQYGILSRAAGQDSAPANAEPVPASAVISDSVDQALQPMTIGGITQSVPLPVLGEVQITTPGTLFMHPMVVVLVLVGLGGLPWVRRSRAAALGFASALVLLLIAFVPPLPDLLQRIMGEYYYARLVLGFVLLLPFAPLAILADAGLRRLAARWGQRAYAAAALALASLTIVLLADPFGIPYGPQAQLAAVTSTLALRDIQPFDEHLLDRLRQRFPAPGAPHSVWLAPNRIASFIIESVPGARITGGRRDENDSLMGALRYYDPETPWLDAQDLAFLSDWGVTHTIMEAGDTRLSQMLLQPQRFRLVEQVDGYSVFEVIADALTATPADALFLEMNRAILDAPQPRFERGAFYLARAGDEARWDALSQRWQQAVNRAPEDASAQLGLAFTRMLAGQDDAASALWQALHARAPALWLPTLALATTLREDSALDAARAMLADTLRQPDPVLQVQAADRLLTEPFSFLMDDALLSEVLAVHDAQPVVWAHLARDGQEQAVRQRISVLLSRGRTQEALRELQSIPLARRTPQDIVLQAAAALALGNPQDAERILQASVSPDDIYARVAQRPDRWAASPVPGLLARLRADASTADLPPDSPLWMARTGQLFVVRATASLHAGDSAVRVSALVGNPYQDGYPVRELHAAVIDSRTYRRYGEVTMPIAPDILLTPLDVDIPLQADWRQSADALLLVLEPRNSPSVFFPAAYLPLTPDR
jgi:hypothetical protein